MVESKWRRWSVGPLIMKAAYINKEKAWGKVKD